MARFELSIAIAARRQEVFDLLTDPERMPRWLPITEEIESVTGSLAEAGSTFRQRGAARIGRPGGVMASRPPEFWHLRLAGMGERVDLLFTLRERAEATLVELDATVKNAPPILGPLLDRLGGARLDRRLWRVALEGLKRELERPPVVAQVGERYVLHGGGHVRIGQVIGVDERYVHLRLLPGTWKDATSAIELLGDPPRPKDTFAIRPLERRLRDAITLTKRGSDALLVDGGFGLAHLPVRVAEFHAAAPEPVGLSAVAERDDGRVAAWRARGDAGFGDPRPPQTGAYYSVALQPMGIEAIGFGVVKLLRTAQFRGVHVRIYSNVFLERPKSIDEPSLEMAALDLNPLGGVVSAPPTLPLSAPLGIGHAPLSHTTFTSWAPEFVEMALVDPDELRGYEEWKLVKGGFL